jgi:hypothetical protein
MLHYHKLRHYLTKKCFVCFNNRLQHAPRKYSQHTFSNSGTTVEILRIWIWMRGASARQAIACTNDDAFHTVSLSEVDSRNQASSLFLKSQVSIPSIGKYDLAPTSASSWIPATLIATLPSCFLRTQFSVPRILARTLPLLSGSSPKSRFLRQGFSRADHENR